MSKPYELTAARELSRAAVASVERDAPALVEALRVRVSVELALSDHEEAERVSRRAVAVAVAEQLPAHPELVELRIRAVEALAVTLRVRGRYREAEEFFRGALAEAEDQLGPEATLVADLLNGLAVTFKFCGRFDEADGLYRRAGDRRADRRCRRLLRRDDLPQPRGPDARALGLRGRSAARAPVG